MNATEYCGYNDWTRSKQKATTDCFCEDNIAPKNIIYVDEDTLYFGDTTQGLDADGYPESLQEDFLTRSK